MDDDAIFLTVAITVPIQGPAVQESLRLVTSRYLQTEAGLLWGEGELL